MNKKTALIAVVLLGVGLSAIFLVKNNESQTLVNKQIPTQSNSQNVSGGWYTYSSSLRYKISYPEDYVIEPSGYYSITMFKFLDEPGAGPANLIYVSVVQPNLIDNEGEIYAYNPTQFNKLQTLKIGESISLADPEQPVFDQYMTYARVDDAEIDGHIAKRFENNKPWEKPEGTTEVRYIFEDNKYKYEQGDFIYILGYYYGGEGVSNPIDAREAFNIISSFQLK